MLQLPEDRMKLESTVLSALAAALLVGCTAFEPTPPEGPRVSLPLQQAWVDGRLVDYVTTDTSDAAMARMMGVNHVPRLAQSLPLPAADGTRPRSALERVYKFVDDVQINVFPSAPVPVGADNRDTAYSPLWLVVEVRWATGRTRRLLTDEESVLAAAERGELSLRVTDIVVNCPVVRSADGKALRGVR